MREHEPSVYHFNFIILSTAAAVPPPPRGTACRWHHFKSRATNNVHAIRQPQISCFYHSRAQTITLPTLITYMEQSSPGLQKASCVFSISYSFDPKASARTLQFRDLTILIFIVYVFGSRTEARNSSGDLPTTVARMLGFFVWQLSIALMMLHADFLRCSRPLTTRFGSVRSAFCLHGGHIHACYNGRCVLST